MSAAPQLHTSYDGSNVTFRVLRALGWGGALLNLGYFPLRGPLTFLNLLPSRHRMADAQRRLLRKALDLLGVQGSDRVLDIACGRGMGAYHIAATNPGADVTGIDLLGSNISVASFLYGGTRGLSYVQGDALDLPAKAGSVDKVLCLEAAFHFPRRDRFLQEVARVLSPGGRAVVVDFAWRDDRGRALLDTDAGRLVRQVWGFADFSTVAEYQADAKAAGLIVTASLDWTSRVTRPLQWLFDVVARLGNQPWGRAVLLRHQPLLRSLSRAEWRDLKKSADAHAVVHGASRYMVFVLEKPR